MSSRICSGVCSEIHLFARKSAFTTLRTVSGFFLAYSGRTNNSSIMNSSMSGSWPAEFVMNGIALPRNTAVSGTGMVCMAISILPFSSAAIRTGPAPAPMSLTSF